MSKALDPETGHHLGCCCSSCIQLKLAEMKLKSASRSVLSFDGPVGDLKKVPWSLLDGSPSEDGEGKN